MRQQGQQNRRNRSRSGRKTQNPLTRNYDSNGPDVKIRGTASHIAEKYSTLARDALSSGDTVAAENLFQHAEHYNRIVMAAQQQSQPDIQPVVQNGEDVAEHIKESSDLSTLIDEESMSDLHDNPKRSNRQGRNRNAKGNPSANGRRRRRRPNGSNGNGNGSDAAKNGSPKEGNSEASQPTSVAKKPSSDVPNKTSEAPPDGAIA